MESAGFLGIFEGAGCPPGAFSPYERVYVTGSGPDTGPDTGSDHVTCAAGAEPKAQCNTLALKSQVMLFD